MNISERSPGPNRDGWVMPALVLPLSRLGRVPWPTSAPRPLRRCSPPPLDQPDGY